MDNRIFNINGGPSDDLLEVLKLAFVQGNFGMSRKAEGWKIDSTHGLILYNYISSSAEDVNKFPVPLSAESVYPIVVQYLADETTWKNASFVSWDGDLQHDGSNRKGWRIYCEDWGHIDSDHGAFLAIRPAYVWYGK